MLEKFFKPKPATTGIETMNLKPKVTPEDELAMPASGVKDLTAEEIRAAEQALEEFDQRKAA